MATNKKTVKKASAPTPAPVKVVDPREALPATDANLRSTLDALRQLATTLPKPEAPVQLDLVHALLHIIFAEGLPCGYGQEAVRRIEESFVDRNEFRVTEAFEVADLLADLEIPDIFARCVVVRDNVNQIYNDQNAVTLDFLREATIADRTNFFHRLPAIHSKLAKFLSNVLSFEEAVFSEKSTQRVMQRLGFDPAAKAPQEFFAEVRTLFAPFGHLPLAVAPPGKLVLTPTLSPLCLVLRLAPSGKR